MAVGYPSPLRERLGEAAVAELSGIFTAQRADIVTLVDGRFEHRLAEECGKLRMELRGEMHALRLEFQSDLKALHGDLTGQLGELKADLIKWSFLFWVGQVVVVMGFLKAFG